MARARPSRCTSMNCSQTGRGAPPGGQWISQRSSWSSRAWQAGVDGLTLALGIARRQLGRDEDLVARQAAVAQGAADRRLVAVHRRGVDVAIADLERPPDGVVGLRASACQVPRPTSGISTPGAMVTVGFSKVISEDLQGREAARADRSSPRRRSTSPGSRRAARAHRRRSGGARRPSPSGTGGALRVRRARRRRHQLDAVFFAGRTDQQRGRSAQDEIELLLARADSVWSVVM